ncbi:MAG: thioredoxin family protein [Clostridiaceae bacterium]
MSYRIMSTPPLGINGRVLVAGRVDKTKEIKEILMIGIKYYYIEDNIYKR